MDSRNEEPKVIVAFSKDEALVLFEWLHFINEVEDNGLFQDQSEQRVLFDLESELERVLTEPFDKNYPELLALARQRIRDVDSDPRV